MAQADEMSSSAADSVQCPVCFKDFTPTTINKHLDVCLLEGAADNPPSTMADSSGPPLKKPRVSAGAAPAASPAVNKPGAGSFSLFHTNKLKPTQQSDRSGLFISKQSAVNNKGLKRGAVDEADGEPAAETSQTSVSVKAAPAPSLLTQNKPLAEILRPNTLDQYFGQSQVVGEQTLIRSLLDSQEIPSLILWGPPGCGKTTLAHIIASTSKKNGTARFVTLSATSTSTNEVREVIKQAQNELRLCKRRTIMFIDEIHRFNKSQQPHPSCFC